MNYTKGEWEIENWGHGISIWKSDDRPNPTTQIAHLPLNHGLKDSEVEANARLIASAPDMYEALKNLIASFRDTPLFATDVVTDALAAIRKAEGK